MDKEGLIKILKNNGIKPNFTYGQNFLIDEFVLQDIADAAGVTKEDNILEIGPGVGNLTRVLAERAGFLLSVEKDPKFFQILHNVKKDFKDNFRFEIADALEFNFLEVFRSRSADASGSADNYGKGDRQVSADPNDIRNSGSGLHYKVVANIPYYITGKILKMLMYAKIKPESVTILTQKEVAQNVCAKPGNLSVLAISVQLFGVPELVAPVLARSFYPAPKVDSAILKITLDKTPRYKLADEKKFFKIVKACFAGKRKQIHNTMTNNLGLDKTRALEILDQLKIKPTSRPQELSIEDWIKLVEKISG